MLHHPRELWWPYGKQSRGALPSVSAPFCSLGRVVQGLGRKCDLRMFVLNTVASFTAWYHRVTLQSSTLAPLGLFVLKANSISSSARNSLPAAPS